MRRGAERGGFAAAADAPKNSAARELLARISAHAAAAHFKILPDPVAFPDYYFFIRHPVALSDMARAMDAGRYTLADMQRDVRRMISNAKKYNKPEAVVYQDSLELEVRAVVVRRARARGRAAHFRPLPPPRPPARPARDAPLHQGD